MRAKSAYMINESHAHRHFSAFGIYRARAQIKAFLFYFVKQTVTKGCVNVKYHS